MQGENLKEALISIESALSFVQGQLFAAEASIRYAQLELDSLTQIIQNLSTQRDTHVCKCNEKKLKEQIFTSGEKLSKVSQLVLDPAQIAEDFWKNLE